MCLVVAFCHQFYWYWCNIDWLSVRWYWCCSCLTRRSAVSSASACVRSGHSQAAAWWSVRRLLATAVRLPVQLRHRADRLRQHRLALADTGAAWTATQPYSHRLWRCQHLHLVVIIVSGCNPSWLVTSQRYPQHLSGLPPLLYSRLRGWIYKTKQCWTFLYCHLSKATHTGFAPETITFNGQLGLCHLNPHRKFFIVRSHYRFKWCS